MRAKRVGSWSMRSALALSLCALALLPACQRSAAGGGGAANPAASSERAGGSSGTQPGVERQTGSVAQTAGDAAEPARPGAQVRLLPEGHAAVTVRVETMLDNAGRARGLMFRRELDEMAGMIFVFPVSEHLSFWMHNTYLPLDMIFIRSDMRVLGVVRNAPPLNDDPREVPGDAQYVLEVRAGFADRHHITEGTRVEFINVPPARE